MACIQFYKNLNLYQRVLGVASCPHATSLEIFGIEFFRDLPPAFTKYDLLIKVVGARKRNLQATHAEDNGEETLIKLGKQLL
jgi:hypothetical protein